jgi:malonate transporter
MFQIINSLFPVFAVIVAGYLAKHYKFLTGEFWPACEKLAYHILLPLILFITISTAPYHDINNYASMLAASFATIVIIILLLFAAKFIFKINPPDFTSILQGSIYANAAYIGIPASLALFGKDGLTAYALLMAAVVPFINAVTIIILGFYAGPDGNIIKTVAKKVALHPIILACILGILFNYLGLSLPAPIFNTLDMISKAAVPVGLVIVGGALDIKAIRGSAKYISTAALVKLILSPVIAIVMAKLLGVAGLQLHILVLYATLPTAAATYVIAKRTNGNAPLMAGIIVFETALAFVTMALVLTWV